MVFDSRESAGRELGEHLLKESLQTDLVLGLPRGGIIVAAEVARAMQLPLDALVVRKIGHPFHREFAVGALAEGGTVVLDQHSLERSSVSPEDLRGIIAEENGRLENYQGKFRRDPPIPRAGKSILIVDDGLATGATTEAAVKSAKEQGAIEVIVAVPVASTHAVDRISKVADRVIALEADPDFQAVGHYYRHFQQTTDDEVISVLHENERLAA